MIRHKSTAAVITVSHGYRQPSEITKQFRMIVRLAVACHEFGVDYDVTWNIAAGRVTITCQGESIPAAKPLPKERKTKLAADWKPKQWEGEYQLEAWFDKNLKRLTPAMVIPHSSGLSLMMACSTGEWGTEFGDADPNGKWSVTHTASGMGFGLSLPIGKASEALLFAASTGVAWTKPIAELKTIPAAVRASHETLALFGNAAIRETATRRLETLAA